MTATAARSFALSAVLHAGLLVALSHFSPPVFSPTREQTFLLVEVDAAPAQTASASVVTAGSGKKPEPPPAASITTQHVATADQQQLATHSTNAAASADSAAAPSEPVTHAAAAEAESASMTPADTAAAAAAISSSDTHITDAGPNEADAASLQQRVRSALDAHFFYPPLARRQGWQGVVKVGLRLHRDGSLSDIHLVASSGYALLDRAALRSLQEVPRLEGGTGWPGPRHFDMVLPVEFRLIDG